MISNSYGYFGNEPMSWGSLLACNDISFDVESTGLSIVKDRAVGISANHNTKSAFWIPIDHPVLEVLGPHLTIGHNLKYDIAMLKKEGIDVNEHVIDTLIAAHLLGEVELSLPVLAASDLGVRLVTYPELKKSFSEMTFDEMAQFSGAHSIASRLLWEKYEPRLRNFGLLKLFHNIEMPFVPVISEMESNGVMVDPDILDKLGVEFDAKMSAIKAHLDELTGDPGINYNSHEQLARLLYQTLGLPAPRKKGKKGFPTTEAKYVEALADKSPVVKHILEYKGYGKLKSTYVSSLMEKLIDGRIYGSFNQAGTRTGRLSSSGPNLQNIPQRKPEGRRIRTAFVAPPGYSLVRADYDQLELRMMAHCAQDLTMIKAFNDGRDIHLETALRVFKSEKRRPEGKTLNFQIIYGGGQESLRRKFFEAYPQIAKWTRQMTNVALEDKYARTIHGRIRVIPELDSDMQWERNHGVREFISTIVQGSSAEVVKIGMVRAFKALKDSPVKIILQVHDEAVYEVPDKDVVDVLHILSETMPYKELSVPMPVSLEVGKSWGEMQEVK